MATSERKTLLDFYNKILEAERAGVQSLNDIIPEIKDEDLKALITSFLRDEGMNCQILSSFIKNLGETPGTGTGDFVNKIKALNSVEEKFKLLVKGQEWVVKQIRYHRDFVDLTSSRIFMEAIKIQHEENVDLMKKILYPANNVS